MNMTKCSVFFSGLPHSPDLNPIEHFWDVLEQEICCINVQQRKVFNILWSPCQEKIKTVLRVKGGPTQYS